MCAKQAEHEAPQFIYRMIGLKPKTLFQSKQGNTDISYDPNTIQEVFLHTIYKGLGARHAELRDRLRPLISNRNIANEEILREVMKILNDKNKHQCRLGQPLRQKSTHVHNTKVDTEATPGVDKQGATATEESQAIKQLSAQVESLTKMVATLMNQQTTTSRVPQSQSHQPLQPPPLQSYPVGKRTARCSNCTEQDIQECNHLFVCGEAGHKAVGCLRRNKTQGNGVRLLSRDSQ